MRRLIAILLSVHLAATISSLAGTRRDDVADVNFVNLGADPRYDTVGRFTYSVGAGSFIASGVLISPEWVLTAAHVVQGNNLSGGGLTGLTFSLTAGAYSFVYTGMQWIPHPGWAETGGNVFAGYDIGLVRLDRPVSVVEPATIYGSFSVSVQPGTIVGYGSTGTGLTGFIPGSAGTKRAGQNMIDGIGDGISVSSAVLFADFDDPSDPAKNSIGSPSPLAMEYLSAPGDSGGGLFITQGANTYLLGITSFGWARLDGNPNSSYGDLAGFVAVSPFLDWINTTINPGLIQTASIANAIPEPETWFTALALLLFAFVLRQRRGSKMSRNLSPR